MRLRLGSLALFALLPWPTLADVQITYPAAGANIAAGQLQITWADSGLAPSISKLTTYTIQLIVGGNDAASQMTLLSCVSNGKFATGSSASCTVPAAIAGSTRNGFFLKFISVASEGGTVVNYSDRFTLIGMTGTSPQAVLSAVQALGGDIAGPPTENNVSPTGTVGAVSTTAVATVGETVSGGGLVVLSTTSFALNGGATWELMTFTVTSTPSTNSSGVTSAAPSGASASNTLSTESLETAFATNSISSAGPASSSTGAPATGTSSAGSSGSTVTASDASSKASLSVALFAAAAAVAMW